MYVCMYVCMYERNDCTHWALIRDEVQNYHLGLETLALISLHSNAYFPICIMYVCTVCMYAWMEKRNDCTHWALIH